MPRVQASTAKPPTRPRTVRRGQGFQRDLNLDVLARAARENRPVLLLLTGRDADGFWCEPCEELERSAHKKRALEAALGRIVPRVLLLEAWVGREGVDPLADHIIRRGEQQGRLGVPALYLLTSVRVDAGSAIGYTFELRPSIKGFAGWRDLKRRLGEVASTSAMSLDEYQDRVFGGLPAFHELWGVMRALPEPDRWEAEDLLLWPLMGRLETTPAAEFSRAAQVALRLARTAEGLSELGRAYLLQSVAETDGSVAEHTRIVDGLKTSGTQGATSNAAMATQCANGVCVLS